MNGMHDYSKDFALAPGHVWLNASSEGPIPKVSAAALQEAMAWKLSPHQLTIAKFQQVPLELKKAIAGLIHVPYDEIILGNSATYGVHLLANGLPLRAGDEIVLMRNDFPTDILPWLHLKDKGVLVHQIQPAGEVLTLAEVEAALTPKTKVVCLPQVHSFSGWPLDITAIGNMCHRHGILFIVNMSQTIGAFEVNVAGLPIDAVVCAGYKWLLGPYGTGFCWVKTELRERLEYPQAYWISLMDENALSTKDEIVLKKDRSSRRYDIFGTANFFNYVPWKASIEYLFNIGMAQVQGYNQLLVDRIIDGMDIEQFELLSPVDKGRRTNIVVFSHRDRARNANILEYLKTQGVYAALWKSKLRLSPHIYNTMEDIERLLSVLCTAKDKI